MSDDVKKSPGRPRKYVEAEVVPVVIPEQPEPVAVPSALPNKAFSLAKNANGRWTVYTFKFNPLTKQVQLVEEKEEFSKRSAVLRFKKAAVEILK